MDDILVAVLSMLLIFALIPLFIWKRRQDSRATDRTDDEPQAVQRENVVRATGARRMRRRPAARASTSSAAVVDEGDESGDEDEIGVENEARGSRKRDKKRQEREAQRQAEQASRDTRLAKQDRYAEARRRKDEEREAEERRLEEEAKARQAKEEAAAAQEFEKWKGAFSIDAEGTTENEAQENQGLLSDFVEYIKKQKCVPLEDLAAEFRMRTQECINRINALENMGRLSGVMDDRGKYIYISLDEMKAVADYIKCQGRVSISHLASKSNQFIDLEPKIHYEEITSVDEMIAA
ncbi:DDRGK domain-containing protein 1 [Amaranthus tricolor]|uniref:DDRGK domain-containing protein 1 n=1 Tax=Amaranthus tricolor TaxID=29722 RepID=UPI00258CF0BE|nr:DDRGK domain-containing protein 1 [Amaranthus tricolor]